MQSMTPKEYLEQYREADKVAQQARQEYEKQAELVDSLRSTPGDGTPRGGTISRNTERQAIKLAEKWAELKEAEAEALRIRQEVYDVIRRVPGAMGSVLYERYINLLKMEDVADAVGYSIRHVYNLHDDGLDYIKDCILLHVDV